MSTRHRIRAAVCAASLAVAPMAFAGPAGASEHSVTFSYTGAPQAFTVPAGVTSIDVDACGAEGGTRPISGPFSNLLGNGPGGKGGRALQTLAVTPGEQLSINVGGSGASGGWNGGGASDSGGTGGGASDVRQGGTALSDRVVVGGGGGGGGIYLYYTQGGPLSGGVGGGLAGGGAFPGTQAGPGTYPGYPARNGSLGAGGNGTPFQETLLTSGGGGGLYGGAAGGAAVGEGFQLNGASGGSGLGATFEPGVCEGDGSVTLTYGDATLPSILPSGAAAAEGQSGSMIWQIPVRLSSPSDEVVTVDWATGDLAPRVGIAQAGSDFVAASGTATFAPGETEVFVPVEILADTDPETPLLWGEWGVVEFSDPSNATIDTGPFFGLGLFIIFDDD